MSHAPIIIRAFTSDDAHAVADLNRAWLDRFALREPVDDLFLEDPAREMIAHGGAIFVAESDGHVVGTCATVPHGPEPGVFEIAKLTVAPAARGQGLGRQLVEACVTFARTHGARTLVLVSNSQLTTALAIYTEMGFVRRPVPPGLPYVTADVYMERDA